MAATIKELANKRQRVMPGHRMCAGCGAGIVIKMVMSALHDEDEVVVANATGCLEVSTCLYPYTSWNCGYIHSAFENAGATISGVEAAYRVQRKLGNIKDNYRFIAFGGDGGTYDIGLQSLSGALERGHDFLYVCYDNEAYMNTGIQRSSATPFGADSTTTPGGKNQYRKDLTAVMAGHNLPYVAQTASSRWKDLYEKSEKGIYTEGPAFINCLTPCPRGWRIDTGSEMDVIEMAVETCFWPLYEVENGVYKLNYKPKNKRPIEDWLKPQGRFAHLFKPENRYLIELIQREVDRRWESLLTLCGEK